MVAQDRSASVVLINHHCGSRDERKEIERTRYDLLEIHRDA
jgi:hypothetical protein